MMDLFADSAGHGLSAKRNSKPEKSPAKRVFYGEEERGSGPRRICLQILPATDSAQRGTLNRKRAQRSGSFTERRSEGVALAGFVYKFCRPRTQREKEFQNPEKSPAERVFYGEEERGSGPRRICLQIQPATDSARKRTPKPGKEPSEAGLLRRGGAREWPSRDLLCKFSRPRTQREEEL